MPTVVNLSSLFMFIYREFHKKTVVLRCGIGSLATLSCRVRMVRS